MTLTITADGAEVADSRTEKARAQLLARRHTEEAIETLVDALARPKYCVQAAVALLDRGWGKPKETVESANLVAIVGGIDAPPLPETLEEWLARRRSELSGVGAATRPAA